MTDGSVTCWAGLVRVAAKSARIYLQRLHNEGSKGESGRADAVRLDVGLERWLDVEVGLGLWIYFRK